MLARRRARVGCVVATGSVIIFASYQSAWYAFEDETPGSCFVLLRPGRSPPFLAGEIASMERNFLANVNVAGTGAVVAAPDHHAGMPGTQWANISNNYYWHWPRDAALVMLSLQTTGRATEEQLAAYAAWEAARLEMLPINHNLLSTQGDFRDSATSAASAQLPMVGADTEPKFAIPGGEIFGEAWCRPQNDAPGLRATALLAYADRLLASQYGRGTRPSWEAERRLSDALLWRADGRSTIQRSLAYLVGGGWRALTCDLWEECWSTDFFWNRVTMKCDHAVFSCCVSMQCDHEV